MKYHLTKKIEKIIDYEPLHNYAIINGEIINIIRNLKIDNVKNQRNIYNFGNNYVISQDIRGNSVIIDSISFNIDKNIDKISSFNFPYLSLYKDLEGYKRNYIICNYQIKKTLFETNEWIGRDIIDDYIFSNDQSIISCRAIKNGEIFWQFNLNQLNISTNSDNEVLNYKVIKFLGVWQNELFIAFNNGLMVALDKNTGKENRKWQYIKGYEFDSEIKNKIPRAESFVFDGDTLIGALNTFYFKIDLKSSKIIAINISQELQKFNIFHIKTVSDNPVTNKHIYLTAMMRQKEGDTKFSYDCLIALNKKTLEIDWHYTFEDAGLGTNIPKLSGNKLYQLDNNQTLHIFEKTTNELS